MTWWISNVSSGVCLIIDSFVGEGNGNPLQCSCLENPTDGGAWWAAVYGVAQSRTRLKRLSSSSSSQTGDMSLIPGSGRSSREGNGSPLQYSCLENSMDGGDWWAIVHGVTKSRTRLSDFTFTFNVSLITPFLACWLLYVLLSEWPNNNLFWILAFLKDYKHW